MIYGSVMVEKQFLSEILMYQNLGGGRNVKNRTSRGQNIENQTN